jgi:hypothetical protein
MLTYEKYNNNRFAVRGDREIYQSFIKSVNGRWNSRMKGGEGWLVSLDKEDILIEKIKNLKKQTKLQDIKSNFKSRKTQNKYRREQSDEEESEEEKSEKQYNEEEREEVEFIQEDEGIRVYSKKECNIIEDDSIENTKTLYKKEHSEEENSEEEDEITSEEENSEEEDEITSEEDERSDTIVTKRKKKNTIYNDPIFIKFMNNKKLSKEEKKILKQKISELENKKKIKSKKDLKSHSPVKRREEHRNKYKRKGKNASSRTSMRTSLDKSSSDKKRNFKNLYTSPVIDMSDSSDEYSSSDSNSDDFPDPIHNSSIKPGKKNETLHNKVKSLQQRLYEIELNK